MSLVGFEILPDGATEDVFVTASGEAPRPFSALKGLATLSLASLREIALPDPADASDPIIIRTDESIRFVDAATGEILREDRYPLAWACAGYRLSPPYSGGHALAIDPAGPSVLPAGFVLALTGLTISLRRRFASSRVRANAPAQRGGHPVARRLGGRFHDALREGAAPRADGCRPPGPPCADE